MKTPLSEIGIKLKLGLDKLLMGTRKQNLIFPKEKVMCHKCHQNGIEWEMKQEIFEDPDKTRSYLVCRKCGLCIEEEPISEKRTL